MSRRDSGATFFLLAWRPDVEYYIQYQVSDHGTNHAEHLCIRSDLQVSHPPLARTRIHTDYGSATSSVSSAPSLEPSWACCHGTSVRVRTRPSRPSLFLTVYLIGSANSHTGSPYGSAAVVAVFLVPLVFIRLYSPPQYVAGVMLICVGNISTTMLLDG